MTTSFRLGNETFTIPPPDQWPPTVTDALNRGQVTEASAALLGLTDYIRYAVAGGTPLFLLHLASRDQP